MSDDTSRPQERTFLQQFCDKHNYKYHCLAKPGATNFVINLQVDHVLQKQPDLVVIGGTSNDRIHVVINEDNRRQPIEVQNIVYSGYQCSSYKELNYGRMPAEFVASDTLNNLVQKRYVRIPGSKKEAVKAYIREIHDSSLSNQIDMCIVRDSLRKLLDNKINFVFIPGPMKHFDWVSMIGDRLWPVDQAEPWDMPYGPGQITNHNPPQAHCLFVQTLETMLGLS